MTKQDIQRLYSKIGLRIRDLREKASLTQATLGKNVNLSRASIVNIEKGRQHPPVHVLWDIAEELDIEVSNLLPKKAEILNEVSVPELSPDVMKIIKKAVGDNPEALRALTGFIHSSQKKK